MFIAALFVIAKNWKQPKYPSIGEWIKKTMVHPYHGIPLSSKKEQVINTYNNLDGSQGHHAEWGKKANLNRPHTAFA